METFGQRLKYAIIAAETNQTKLADDIGRSKGAISQWVNDETQPDMQMLATICDTLHVSADFLVRGIETRYVDAKTDALLKRLAALEEPARAGLYDLIFGKSASDDHVEQSMPVTRAFKRVKRK